MQLICDEAVFRILSEQKKTVPDLIKMHRPVDKEQAMYLAFRIAKKCINESKKDSELWFDVTQETPRRNGLYLVTVRHSDGRPRIRTVFFIDGRWTGEFEITHWTYLPAPYREDSYER